MRRRLINGGLAGLFTMSCLLAQAPSEAEVRDANLKVYAELLRKDIRAESRQIVKDLMQLDAAQEAKFQPIYDEFDRAFRKLVDERATSVKLYSDSSRSMNDQMATRLAKTLLDMESSRVQLKRQTVDRITKALGPVAALRFLEIQSQLEELLDLQANASLPVVE
jgi:hypothetical protein